MCVVKQAELMKHSLTDTLCFAFSFSLVRLAFACAPGFRLCAWRQADELTGQVLEELGLELGGKMQEAPSAKLPAGKGAAEEEEDLASLMPDLQARLKAL